MLLLKLLCDQLHVYNIWLFCVHSPCRSRTYQFEEFLQSWGDKLKVQAAGGAGGGASTITVKLLQDVDRFAVCYVLLSLSSSEFRPTFCVYHYFSLLYLSLLMLFIFLCLLLPPFLFLCPPPSSSFSLSLSSSSSYYIILFRTCYIQSLLPLLKYVRGEVLSPDHWHELFRMLGMPRGTILEKLTFGDIIKVADAIIGMIVHTFQWMWSYCCS